MKIYNTKEIIKEIDKLYEVELLLFDHDKIKVLIDNGELVSIPGHKELFAFTEWEENGCIWYLEGIYEVAKKFASHFNLAHPLRYKAVCIKAPENYCGVREYTSSFSLNDDNIEILDLSQKYYSFSVSHKDIYEEIDCDTITGFTSNLLVALKEAEKQTNTYIYDKNASYIEYEVNEGILENGLFIKHKCLLDGYYISKHTDGPKVGTLLCDSNISCMLNTKKLIELNTIL